MPVPGFEMYEGSLDSMHLQVKGDLAVRGDHVPTGTLVNIGCERPVKERESDT